MRFSALSWRYTESGLLVSKDKDAGLHIVAHGYLAILRGWLASDIDPFMRWLTQGEWRLLDAPWEGFGSASTSEEEQRTREWFMNQLDSRERSWFNNRAVIATPDNIPLGWVNRYGDKKDSTVVWNIAVYVATT